MNTMPKTDECIKMLGEAQFLFRPFCYSSKGFFEKDGIINFQNRIKAMLNYRLMPFGVITIPDNADKDTARKNPILQNIGDFDAFWYAMKNYQLVTADDLRNEFWSICPDLESISKFLDVMNVKFDGVNHKYDTDINQIKENYNGLNELVNAGKISEQEADDMFWNIHFIADRYNFIMCCIRKIYKTFREMVKPQQADTVQPQQPPYFTCQFTPDEQKKSDLQIIIPDNILQALEREVCITQNPLKWLKSKSLLAYFVDVINDKLNLKHGEKRQVRAFETMFNETGLSGAINDYKKTGQLPIDHEIIDKILI
jgi:hypothetical protein